MKAVQSTFNIKKSNPDFSFSWPACEITQCAIDIEVSVIIEVLVKTFHRILMLIVNLENNITNLSLPRRHDLNKQHTYTQPFYGQLSRTIRGSRYQKQHSPTLYHEEEEGLAQAMHLWPLRTCAIQMPLIIIIITKSIAWELIPFYGLLSQRGYWTQLSQHTTKVGLTAGSN